MNEPVPLDRLRDLLDGQLPAAEAESLRGEIAADAALRADFESLRLVHAMTAVEAAIPASRVTWADIAPHGRAFPLRLSAAAALVAGCLAIGAAASLLRGLAAGPSRDAKVRSVAGHGPALRTSGGPEVVDLAVLRAPGTAPAAPPEPVTVPDGLAAFEVVRAGRPNWISEWDRGLEVARATGKPVLLYVFHPTCPWCEELDAEAFSDPGVLADLAEFVPVRVDVTTAPQDVTDRLDAGWPYLAAIEADGRGLREFAGLHSLVEVRPELGQAVDAARRADPLRPTWEQVRTASAALARSALAEHDGRLGDAWVAARAASDAAPHAAPGRAGLARARAIEARATRVLAAAESAAAHDAASAAQAVEAAARAFHGSAPGADLEAVAHALRHGRGFPILRETPR